MRLPYSVAVCLLCVLCGTTITAISPIAEYKTQLGRIIGELNQHQKWIGAANEQILAIEKNIKDSDARIAEISKDIAELEVSIGELEARIEELEADRDSWQTKTTALIKSVGWHLHAEYRLQKNHWLKNLLDYDEPRMRARFIRYHQIFVRSKTLLLDEFNSAMITLAQSTQELQRERSRLNHERKLADSSKESMKEQIIQREVQIANLENEIYDSEVRVEKLTLDQQRIRKLIYEIDALGLDVPAEFTSAAETISSPVDGKVVRKFGESRADGRLTWKGVVFSANDNSDVVAVAAGRVVMADWFQGYGLIVIIDHGDDIKTIYANCNSLLVDVGDYVEAGEVIAKTGQSGGSTIPGLYFEVLEKSIQVDPILWLQARED